MQSHLLALAAVFAVVLTPTAGSAQRADLRRLVIGRWELNVAKSTFRPGPPPKSWTRTYEASGENVKYTDSLVDADGKAEVSEWTGSYDGKDHPFAGSPDYDAQAVKASNPFRATFTLKKAGKVVGSGTRVISRDGKVMTIRLKLTNAKGQTFNNIRVFEKR